MRKRILSMLLVAVLLLGLLPATALAADYVVKAVSADETMGTATATDQGNGTWIISAEAKSGYVFLYWKQEGSEEQITSKSYTFTATQDVTFTAYFRAAWVATAVSANEELGTVSVVYRSGDSWEISATPVSGYAFSHWQVNGSDEKVTRNPYTVTLTGDTTFTGYFRKAYVATVQVDPETPDRGTVSATYKEGDKWKLEAVAAKGFSFEYWSNSANVTQKSTSRSFTAKLKQDTVYTAHFSTIEISLGENASVYSMGSTPSVDGKSYFGPSLFDNVVLTEGLPLALKIPVEQARRYSDFSLAVNVSYKDGDTFFSFDNDNFISNNALVCAVDAKKLKEANGQITVTLTGAQLEQDITRDYTLDLSTMVEANTNTQLEKSGMEPVSLAQTAAVTDELTGQTTIYVSTVVSPGGTVGAVYRRNAGEEAFTRMTGDYSFEVPSCAIYAIGGTDSDHTYMLLNDKSRFSGQYYSNIFIYTLNEEDHWVKLEGGDYATSVENKTKCTFEGGDANIKSALVLGNQIYVQTASGWALWDGRQWAVLDLAKAISPDVTTVRSLTRMSPDTMLAQTDLGLWKYEKGRWTQVSWSVNVDPATGTAINEGLEPTACADATIVSTGADGTVIVKTQDGSYYLIRTDRLTDSKCVRRIPMDSRYPLKVTTMGVDANGKLYVITQGVRSIYANTSYDGSFLFSVDLDSGMWTLENVNGNMYDYNDAGAPKFLNAYDTIVNPMAGLTLIYGSDYRDPAQVLELDQLPEVGVDLDSVKQTAKAYLTDYLARLGEDNYSEENYQQLLAAWQAGLDAIDAAADTKAVKQARNDAMAAMDAVEKDRQGVKTVWVSMSEDGSFLVGHDLEGTVLSAREITVEYFDLADYGLERFYKYNDEGELVTQPTMLHLFIQLLEEYYLANGEKLVVDQSKYNESDQFYALHITGTAASMYMENFWGHDENLTYFHNHQYPLMREGVGSTADWILLENGDYVELAMYTDWSFWQSSGAGFRYFVDADGNDVNSLTEATGTLTVRRATADSNGGRGFVNEANADIYYIPAEQLSGSGSGTVSTENGWRFVTRADENGEFTFDLSELEPGDYYIATPGNDVSAPGAIQLTVPVHIHDFERTIVEVTCSTDGYAEYTCACGYSYRDSFVPAQGHVYDEEIIQPTHNTMGYTIHTCPACGSSYVDSFTDALEHEFTTEITKPATCQSEGEITFTCACGESYVMVLPVGDHDCESKVVEATCKSIGYTTYTCKNCEFTFISDLVPAVECPSKGFTDVETGTWYHEAVDYAIANGLMNGTGTKTFEPNGTTTRSMMATLLYRMAGEPDVTGLENPFTDVPAEAWYNKAVIWAFNEGVVTGATATTFNPDGKLTREQLAVMLWRYAGKPEADETVLNGFADVKNVGSYAKAAMAWAVENGLVNGVGNNALDPTGTATRAQIATILMRYINN